MRGVGNRFLGRGSPQILSALKWIKQPSFKEDVKEDWTLPFLVIQGQSKPLFIPHQNVCTALWTPVPHLPADMKACLPV